MKKFSYLLLLFILLSSFSSTVLQTKLQITVLNHLGNIVQGASVEIYANEEDYRKEENALRETRMSDEKGRVMFNKLEEKVYWLHVHKDDLNNNGAGVKTDKLTPKKVNKVNIIIE